MEFLRRDRYASLVLVAALVAVVLVVLITTDSAKPNNLVYHYQNLLAGLIALVAALIGYRAVQGQIAVQRALESERRERRLMAARVVLPLAVASIIDHVEHLNRVIRHLYETPPAAGPQLYPHLPSVPRMPENSVSVLKEFVEASPESVAMSVAKVLSELQILVANVEDFARSAQAGLGLAAANNLIHQGARAANIYARAGNILKYARFEDDQLIPSVAVEDIGSAAFVLNDGSMFGRIVRAKAFDLYGHRRKTANI